MSNGLPAVSLDDRYTATSGRVYLHGTQALARLMRLQKWRDKAAGLHAGGFVSGYRGSPIGGIDEAFWHAQKQLDADSIKFLPGVDGELAATAVWGTQQGKLIGDSAYDSVFSMRCGKAPGVDRCSDAFKHMSHGGTSAWVACCWSPVTTTARIHRPFRIRATTSFRPR